MPLTELPAIEASRLLEQTRALSSDAFQGRKPGTEGETRTVAYLEEQFKALGLQPGNTDGTYVQDVRLVGLTPSEQRPLTVAGGGKKATFAWRDEVVAWTKHVADQASLENSELVFVGYGVTAPEFDWNDFKDVDVKGKTLVVLVNDPQVPAASDPSTLDDAIFGGRAMTYYGRWTYKYEEAARRGAAGVLIVHETGPAGYPFTVVQGNLGERLDLVTADKNMSRANVEGWLSLDAARKLMTLAGHDLDALKKQALTRDFTPVPLGLSASMAISNKIRTMGSKNVLAKLEGSDPALKDEYVVYTAHWDHFGVGRPVDGDTIYNGALDNASGTAMVLEIARAFTQATPKPKRSVLFLMVTAEEQGLLGSAYYAEYPVYPARQDGGRDQHRRHQPVGPHQGHDRDRSRCLATRRLPARGRHRAGPHTASGPGVGEGLLLSLRPLQLRQEGRAGALHRHRHRVRGQGRQLRHAEARRVHEPRLPQPVRRGEGRLGPHGRRGRRAAADGGGLPRGQRLDVAGVGARQRIPRRARRDATLEET